MNNFSRARHVVNLSAGGRLHRSGDLYTPAAQLGQILDGFKESGLTSMTLFFHGGLVNEQEAERFAKTFYAEIWENFESYPVFFIWESGPLESLESSLTDVFGSSPLFMQVLRKLMKHVARKLGRDVAEEALFAADMAGEHHLVMRALEDEELPAGSPARLSVLDPGEADAIAPADEQEVDQLLADLAADAAANESLQAIIDNAQQLEQIEAVESDWGTDSRVGFVAQEVLTELLARTGATGEPPTNKGDEESLELGLPDMTSLWFFVGKVFVATIRRFAEKTDHGFMGTILEEMYRNIYVDKIGKFLWDEMKENAQDAYAANPPEEPTDDFHGGTLFLNLLQAHMAEHGPIDLHLVGHSAGCIHICHCVDAIATLMDGDFTIKTVVFTAPACNLETFNRFLVPHFDIIEGFRIFDMNDELERQDPLVKWLPVVYPHSLLYLVSGLFEAQPDTTLLGLDRHLRGARYRNRAEVIAANAFLTRVGTSALVFSITPDDAPSGAVARFTSHYGVPGPVREEYTVGSIAAMIRPTPLTELVSMEIDVVAEFEPFLEPSAAVLLPVNSRTGHGGDDNGNAALSPGDFEPMPDDATNGLTVEPILEAIIGTNEIVDHAILAGLLLAGRSVARVVVSGVDGLYNLPPDQRAARWQLAAAAGNLFRGHGTGWVLGSARRVLITNNHVVPLVEAARTAKAEFGYERDLRVGARAQRILSLQPDELFITSPNMKFGGLDYTVVALREQLPATFGYLEPAPGVSASAAENIFIVQHPRGDPKAYALNHNRKVNLTDKYVAYVSDTEGGSSGSPLFDDRLRVIGIHHLGNHQVNVGSWQGLSNLGSRIEVVIADLVQQLHSQGQWDESRIVHWFGEGAVLGAWRAMVSEEIGT